MMKHKPKVELKIIIIIFVFFFFFFLVLSQLPILFEQTLFAIKIDILIEALLS